MSGAVKLYETLEPCVTDTIWFGKLNGIKSRVVAGTSQSEIDRIESGQTDDAIRLLYSDLKSEPKVRWKESYKSVIGLDLAKTAGLDL